MRLPILLVALCACNTLASGDRVNPDSPNWFTHASWDMNLMFRRTLTIDGRKVGEEFEQGRPEIDAVHGRVFVGSSDRGLYALRAMDGSDLCRFENIGMVQCEPLYDPEQDLVYFGSNDGALYAIHAENGALLWRYNTGTEVNRKPVLWRDRVIFVNSTDQVFAVDRMTGQTKWQSKRTPALGMEIGGYGGPTLDGSTVFVVFSDGHAAAYDADAGKERWIVDLSAEAEQSNQGETQRWLDVDTTPAVVTTTAGKLVVLASYAGGVYALDQENGARMWANAEAKGVHAVVHWHQRAHDPHPKGPEANGPDVPARDILFATSSSTGLWALDPETGRKIWRLPVPEGGITAPASVAGAIAIGTTRYGLFLLSPRDGRVIDGIDFGAGFAVTPATFGNRLYAMTNAGTLLGLGVDPPLGRRQL